jgi:hypothetical protein
MAIPEIPAINVEQVPILAYGQTGRQFAWRGGCAFEELSGWRRLR